MPDPGGSADKPPERAETVGKPGGIQERKIDLRYGRHGVEPLLEESLLPEVIRSAA